MAKPNERSEACPSSERASLHGKVPSLIRCSPPGIVRAPANTVAVKLRAALVTTILGVLLCVIAGVGVAHLRFDSSYRVYFDADDPLLTAFDTVRNTFDPSDALLILVVADPGRSVLSAEGLAKVRDLTSKAWMLPKVRRVDSLTNYQQISGDADGFAVHDLVAPNGPIGEAAARQASNDALGDPLIKDRLVDRGGRIAVIAATLTKGTASLEEVNAIIATARAMIAKNQTPGYRLHLSGIVAMNHAFAESSQRDFTTLVPAAFLLFFVIIAWTSGTVLGASYVMALSVLSILAAVGLLGWLNVPMTSASAMGPLMLMTITIADGVHILMACRAGIRAGKTADDALADCMRMHGRLIAVTAAATIIGFLTGNTSNVPALRVMGNLVAVGATIACFMSLYWLPALLKLRMPRWPRATPGPTLLDGMFEMNERRALWICGFGTAMLMAAPFGLKHLELNDEFVRYFSPDIDFRKAADLQNAHLGSLYEIEFAVDSLSKGGVSDPRYLNTVVQFESFLRGLPETRHVMGWTDVLRKINAVVERSEGRTPADMPQNRALASQYLLMYQLSLPFGQDANNLVNVDQSSSRVVAMFGELSSQQMLAIESKVDDWWQGHGNGYKQHHGSINLIFSHLGKLNVLSMIQSDIYAVLVIAAMIALALRSWLAGVLSLFMNFMPLVIAFAIWGALVGFVGLSMSAAPGMSLGILVDDAVHLLAHYGQERRHGHNVTLSLRSAMKEISPPVLVTNIALIVGFGLVGFSSFQLNAHLGWITAITLVLALGLDLVLLPAMVLVGGRWMERRAARSATLVSL